MVTTPNLATVPPGKVECIESTRFSDRHFWHGGYDKALMVQQILDRPYWRGRLTARDMHALTPLFWGHINPYGRFELDMQTRIALA